LLFDHLIDTLCMLLKANKERIMSEQKANKLSLCDMKSKLQPSQLFE
jgi:hypothetical protein